MSKVTLHHGDCIDHMKKIKSGSVDLVVVDPPYKMTKKGSSCRPNYMPDSMGDNFFEGALPDTKDWLSECFRCMTDSSHMYIFTNTITLQEFLNVSVDLGFKLHNVLTMIKDTRMPSKWYYKECELILFFRKGRAKSINDMTSKDWIHVEMPTQKNGKVHPTQKPYDLVELLVTNSTTEDQTVLDPFMGSGTTGVAAKQTGRNFIGIELDENYFNIAKSRIDGSEDIEPDHILF